jgi:hypothetical protein
MHPKAVSSGPVRSLLVQLTVHLSDLFNQNSGVDRVPSY